MNDYVEYILEQLSDCGSMKAKPMFGGYGIYKEGIIIGLIIENELYFKASKETENDFRVLDSVPFTYVKKDKMVSMSYWKVPAEVLENKDKLFEFTVKAHSVSLASKKKK